MSNRCFAQCMLNAFFLWRRRLDSQDLRVANKDFSITNKADCSFWNHVAMTRRSLFRRQFSSRIRKVRRVAW